MKKRAGIICALMIMSFGATYGNINVYATGLDSDIVEDIIVDEDANSDGATTDASASSYTSDASAATSSTTSTASSTKSADNSLKSLSLSSGSLSPAFSYSVTSYTASVGNDVTSVKVSAATSSSKASISGISGGDSLVVGDNVIKVITVAENGNKAMYTITVTRAASGTSSQTDTASSTTTDSSASSSTTTTTTDESTSTSTTDATTTDSNESTTDETAEVATVTALASGFTDGVYNYNGSNLSIMTEIPAEKTEAGFSLATINIDGVDYPCLKADTADVYLLYLDGEAANDAKFYLYDPAAGLVYDYFKLTSNESYAIILSTTNVSAPDGFNPASLSINELPVVSAFQSSTGADSKEADFYLLYCLNQNGELGWYQYDATEGTYQRYIERASIVEAGEVEDTVNEDEDATKKKSLNLGYIKYVVLFIILAAALFAVNIYMSKRGGKNGKGLFGKDKDDSYLGNLAMSTEKPKELKLDILSGSDENTTDINISSDLSSKELASNDSILDSSISDNSTKELSIEDALVNQLEDEIVSKYDASEYMDEEKNSGKETRKRAFFNALFGDNFDLDNSTDFDDNSNSKKNSSSVDSSDDIEFIDL